MNSEEVMGFLNACVSPDEYFVNSLKLDKHRREMPLKPTVTYSPPDGGKMEFQEIIEKYYLPWLPTEEQLGYEIFKQALFANQPLLRIAGKFNISLETTIQYLDYFTQIVSRSIPYNIYQEWSGEIRGALKTALVIDTRERSERPSGSMGIACAACDDVEFEEAMLKVKPQIHFLMNKYKIWGFYPDDVRQVILIALNMALHTFDPKQNGGHFKSYFQLIAENSFKNEIKRSLTKKQMALNKAIMGENERRISIEGLDIPRKSPNGDGTVMLERLLDLMTGRLSPDAQSILIWRLRGLGLKAIAKKQKMKPTSIKRIYGEARDLVRFIMDGAEERAEKLKGKRKAGKAKHRKENEISKPAPISDGKLHLKPGSLFDAIVRSVLSHNQFEEHDKIFNEWTGNTLIAKISVSYRTLIREVALDEAYLNGLERLKELAQEGSKTAQSKLDRTHGERLREAMYLLSMSGTAATNKNAARFKRAGLAFIRAQIGEDELLFLIRSKHQAQLEAALARR